MNDFMEVFRLRFEKRMSYRNIAVALGIGCSTVHEIIGRFSTLGLPWPLPADYSTEFLEQNLFPGRDYEQNKSHPDWLLVDAELSRKGVTKQLLWIEYQSVYGEQALGYTLFCWYFRKWKKSQRLSMRQHHIAGEKLFIDFCGPTVPAINPDKGSTIVISQLPVDKWYGLMENPTTADALLDRLIHGAHRLNLQGESMRKNKE